jgi:hypothetical protein
LKCPQTFNGGGGHVMLLNIASAYYGMVESRVRKDK